MYVFSPLQLHTPLCTFTGSASANDVADMVCVEMRARGLLTKPTQGKCIRFAPPLMISHAQMDEAVSIIASSYRAVDQKL